MNHIIRASLANLLLLGAITLMTAAIDRAAAREEHFRIPGYPASVRIFLRHLPRAKASVRSKGSVLFVHGASFPSALAAAFKFDGHSWMDDLSQAGFEVWALDFAGYGESDRYPEMSQPADANRPLGRTDVASKQIDVAVRFICERQKTSKVSIVAHSWGTIPAGLYATQEPERIERLVLFGPLTLRNETGPSESVAEKAYLYVTEEAQHTRFYGYVPSDQAPVIENRYFDVWGPAYLASDPTSSTRIPPSVKVPAGPLADASEAWTGRLFYDPAKIEAPTLIIRGEWDIVTKDDDAHWLYRALRSVRIKRDVVISRGTHVMHLERSRFQLYREVQTFLEANDQ